ncbi:SMP-30/gluconolactonase/LRE family protein [Prosthecodimorpha staleyi]|uniref:SMP-30/gluconolactonase/LRE family protein n=1 Tax=Prosthecodimorpha staleyi TaxID=2840188 RepID=A0A947GH08_9HYPH|nr:SMP-30/gluconolactonase/LRE family protein [Prosthecodimorpha staleyi]MBT9293150.1 SMP-30/gluconolactonase/LRE family protein [Prosthecodimorpha staleyi]
MTMSAGVLRVAGLWLAGLLTIGAAGPAGAVDGPVGKPEILDRNYQYPEGAYIHRGILFMTDMSAGQIKLYDAKTAAPKTVWSIQNCGPTGIVAMADDQYLINCHLAGAVVFLDRNGQVRKVVAEDGAGTRIRWPNDLTTDGDGGAFVTDSGLFDASAPATGSIVHVWRDGRAERLKGGIRYANGIYFDTATRDLFVSEHIGRRILAYKVTADFTLADDRVLISLGIPKPSGFPFYDKTGPDGIDVDENDNLLVPEYGAGRIMRISRKGEYLGAIPVPMQFVTTVIRSDDRQEVYFGGPSDIHSAQGAGAMGRIRLKAAD